MSFAVYWIRAEIHLYVLRNWRLVKVTTTKTQRKLFSSLRKRKKDLGWLSGEERKAGACDLGVYVREVREMEERLSPRDVSFGPVPDCDEEESYSPALCFPANNADPALELEREERDAVSSERLAHAMEEPDSRSRSLRARRCFTDQKWTLHALAAEYVISA